MAHNISNTIYNVFAGDFYGASCRAPRLTQKGVYLEIPLDGEVIELPCFAATKFGELLNNDNINKVKTLAFELKIGEGQAPYKTFSRNIIEFLLNSPYGMLQKVKLNDSDDLATYYISHGIVFNNALQPIFLCSWELKRTHFSGDSREYFVLDTPIIRLSRSCYAQQKDSMQKYLVKKFSVKALEYNIWESIKDKISSSYCIECKDLHNVKSSIRIEDFPFKIKNHKSPSIHTTNANLWKIIIDNINDALI